MLKYWLLLFLLVECSLANICKAQNDPVKTDSTVVTADSTVSAPNADPEGNSTTTIDRKDSIQYFDQITQQPIFYERKIHDSTIQRIKKEEAYWYADQTPGKQKPEPEKKNSSFLAHQWVLNLIWIVMLIVFVCVLVWYLAAGNIRVFRKAPIRLNEEHEIDYEEDLFTINFESEIRKAIDSNNYRLAIRLLFLSSLKQLNNNGVIVYKPTKTNADYLFHLYGSPYYKPFFRLSRFFDYVWYGKFQIDADGFKELQKEFVQFNDLLQQ
jgi:hypothetical protein